MTILSRRNVMTFLGLTTASSAALATDAMLDRSTSASAGSPQLMGTNWDGGKRVAESLRRLASGIETGEVNVNSLNLTSEIRPDEWLEQVFTLKFELLDPKA